ncbi:MAG: hypothetical protein H9993_02385, partial [Candidatus Desulfovibrio faecigallinarum]|nr:hypothetical protein [Candidatus Desulfovibrio faecigallinarum]
SFFETPSRELPKGNLSSTYDRGRGGAREHLQLPVISFVFLLWRNDKRLLSPVFRPCRTRLVKNQGLPNMKRHATRV